MTISGDLVSLEALEVLETLELLELLELLESLSTLSTPFDAISVCAAAACFAVAFAFPISLKMYHASTAPSTMQINFSVLFIVSLLFPPSTALDRYRQHSKFSKSFFHRPFAGTGSYP